MNDEKPLLFDEQSEEKRLKVLLRGELYLPHCRQDTIEDWFNKALSYLQYTEDYERMTEVRDARIRYHKQLSGELPTKLLM